VVVTATGRPKLPPVLFRLVQQGCHVRAGQGVGDALHHPGHDLCFLLVATALQDVLDFQLQLCGQAT
jgi:hypothetical protein